MSIGKYGKTVQELRANQTQEVPKHSNKKNTKRWCKGVVGREHHLIWVKSRRHFSTTMVLLCDVCKKELDYCWWSKWSQKPCKCGFHTEAQLQSDRDHLNHLQKK